MSVSVFVLFPLCVSAQTVLKPEVMKLLDSSLALLDMKRCDLAMPWGIPATDKHIMPEVARMFTEPLTAFERVKFYTDRLKSLNGNNVDDFSYALLPAVGLGNYTPTYYEATPNTRQLNEILKVTPDSLVGFVGAATLQRFIIPLIPALSAVARARSSITSDEILLQLCDSLLLLDKESETANLYELKAGEERSLQQAKDFYSAAARIDADRLYSAGMSLYRAYLNLVSPGNDALALMRDSIRTTVIQTQYGKIALGGAGNDIYDGDYILILDVGGNDRYYFPNNDKKNAVERPVRIVIDLGGNDIYNGGDFSLGGALFGISLLFDMSGNDVYSAGNFSLGCGLFGVGILHDFAGTDRYIGKICSQGAAAFGIGILFDDDGNDSYTAESNAQGFGSTRGFGAVCDRSGNDIYAACSPFQDFLRYDAHYVSFTQGASLGSRPIAAGGIGILADFQGNDTYISDIYGQGTAYWFGLGALYDEDGDDRYQAYQYAQGAGVHFGFGTLWDVKGSDSYVSHGVSQGCGHDIAMGALLDEEGDDDYHAESLSLGGGNANAVSLFLDLRGNDCYTSRNVDNTMGYSDFRRNYGMIGIFADGGGNDLYGETVRNNRVSRKSTYGLFYDAELIPTEIKQQNEPALTPPDEQKEPLRSTLDSLFIQASAAPQKFQYNVEPARNAIIEQGGSALPFLRTKFGNESPRERLALEIILPKIWDKDSALTSSIILDSLTSENIVTFGLCATIAGRKKFSPAVPALINRLNSEDWRICAIAAQQLGEIGDVFAATALQQTLTYDEPLVRARTAFSIGQLLPDTALQMLKPAIYDSMQITRNSAIQGLLRNKILPVSIIQEAFSDHFTSTARQRLAVLLSKVDSTDSISVSATAALVVRQKKILREYIYRSIIEKRFPVSPRLTAQLAVSEKDERLVKLLAGYELPPSSEKVEKKSKKKKKKNE